MGMRNKSKNWFEWVVFSVGLFLLISAASFLVYRAATSKSHFTEVSFKTLNIETAADGYNVVILAMNTGDATLEDVLIEGSLEDDGEREKVEVEIPLLPDDSAREITLNFTKDPRNGRLSFRTVRFAKP